MATLTAPTRWWFFSAPEQRSDERTDPPAPAPDLPVFIYDAVTPFKGETLLLARLRADFEQALEEADGD